MFIGHYSAAFAAKAIKPEIKLWQLFVAVQLVDFVWAGLVLIGVEKVRITPGFMEASMLDLYHMPYTHSLPSAILWGALTAIFFKFAVRSSNVSAAAIFGLAVFSHWALDLLVHAPDLELYWGGPKIGFGLWSSIWLSQGLELGLFLICAAWYLKSTRRADDKRHWTAFALLALMAAIQIYSLFPPPEIPTTTMFAVQAILAYSVFAFMAWRIERPRKARSA